jgi:predicted nucleic acid-binding protein
MFLVDTNIVSAVAPTKSDRNQPLQDWFERASDWLYISVVTSAEIRSGILKARREGATKKASTLSEWWQTVEHLYATRFLTFDHRAAEAAAAMIDRSRADDIGFEDIAIAATAEAHGFTVLTDNERHFLPLGVAMLNPLKALPQLPSQH